ncbi:alpha/beta fold hydrolase [Streptomyces sp. NPDC002888]|uniref:alpha/beta fold hydrolase n=1 Tax=Streptomyces sp. NPDC002888 TaxID=3364668 RepID=UPI0036B5CCF7
MATAVDQALTEAATSHFAKVTEGEELKDFSLHYQDAGEGPVVIMLHGGGPGASGWSNFERNIGPFADAGFRVLLVDQPGYAKSGEIVSGTQRGLLNARAVKGLMDALEIDKAHLVGNSMGGATSLNMAVEYPERVDSLVLMAPGGVGPSILQPNPQEGIKYVHRLVADPTPENMDLMLDALMYDASVVTPELRAHRLAAITDHPQHIANLGESLRRAPISALDIRSRLGEVQAKTLVVWGRDDRFVPLDHGLLLVASLPDADLHVFQRCGHSAQWEQAEKFNRLVIQFLQS